MWIYIVLVKSQPSAHSFLIKTFNIATFVRHVVYTHLNYHIISLFPSFISLFAAIIKSITIMTLYMNSMWWPPQATFGGFINQTIFLISSALTLVNFAMASVIGPGHLPFGWRPKVIYALSCIRAHMQFNNYPVRRVSLNNNRWWCASNVNLCVFSTCRKRQLSNSCSIAPFVMAIRRHEVIIVNDVSVV